VSGKKGVPPDVHSRNLKFGPLSDLENHFRVLKTIGK
jgi:hypothetical protein